MTYRPYGLAMDGVLCDRPQDGCFIGGISRKERGYARDDTSKEKRMTRKMLSDDQLSHYVGMSIKNPAAANRYWARCMGQDATMDDETVARIKEFLSDKLSDKDHTKLCSMLDGESEAQDEPPPDGTEPPAKFRGTAEDAKADFLRMFPDAAKIGIDNSGIALPRRPANPRVAMDAADAASFKATFPDAARIKVL